VVLRFAWAFDYLTSRAVTAARGATLIMPDIDPAALSRPSIISTTPILPPKTISASSQIIPKVSKSNHVPARVDLEPLYTALKLAIGEHWATYKESISLFVMG
jgi:transcriptional coactivator HFI1/ADA1